MIARPDAKIVAVHLRACLCRTPGMARIVTLLPHKRRPKAVPAAIIEAPRIVAAKQSGKRHDTRGLKSSSRHQLCGRCLSNGRRLT